MSNFPAAQGLYHPSQEHDACGLGFIVNIAGKPSHDIVLKGLQILTSLEHRGACGCDEETGDGAGILIQIPHQFFLKEGSRFGLELPAEAGDYGVPMCFLPVERQPRLGCEGVVERMTRDQRLVALGWRDPPVDVDSSGRVARAS